VAGLLDDTGYTRATVLPYRTNDATGEQELALPGLLASPMQAWVRALDAARAGRQVDPIDALEVAGAGVTGGLLAPVRAGRGVVMGAGPVVERRASTRFPTAAKATEDPVATQLSIGLPEMRASPTFDHNVSLLSQYPGFARLRFMEPDEAAQQYVRQTADNLKWLYRNAPESMQQRSPNWYDGASEFSQALSQRYGVPTPSSSAAVATLSPQKDWFQNASLAERVGDIVMGPASSRIMTPDMRDIARYAPGLQSELNQELFRRIAGKTLSQLQAPDERALWIRLYDEAHNPRHYRVMSPEGLLGDFARNADGSPSKVAWGSLGEIGKAAQAYASGGDMAIISPLLGTRHKVRNFYNNIELPNDLRFGDVTADTHQVAAMQLRPLSGASPAVTHNLATSMPPAFQPPGYRAAATSSIDGVQGTYGLGADATRLAASEVGLLPRQMQSATWEPVRELFTPEFKTQANSAVIDSIWNAYDRGAINIDEARRRILQYSGGIGRPSWDQSGSGWAPASRSSTYR
jgi:hypothetical protein